MKEKKYEIRYSKKFNEDVSNSFKYIVNELGNIIAAEKLMILIKKEIEKRSEIPESFKAEKIGKFEWYRININNYIIFYTVDKSVITFRRFLYNKRNFDKLL